nr:MAG TPA: hypothetical protein [Caudoviricetes sp.]
MTKKYLTKRCIGRGRVDKKILPRAKIFCG